MIGSDCATGANSLYREMELDVAIYSIDRNSKTIFAL